MAILKYIHFGILMPILLFRLMKLCSLMKDDEDPNVEVVTCPECIEPDLNTIPDFLLTAAAVSDHFSPCTIITIGIMIGLQGRKAVL
jgi:hypothetical protein